MLADTGAIASLVDKRVLKRLGRASEPLRPYTGSLNSVLGHAIRVSGVIDLPVTLETLVWTLPFVVADHLFVDAILGTDSLRAFCAVIDLEEQNMTMKGTGDVILFGATRVEETYATSVNSPVHPEPGRQARVRSSVRGTVRNHSVVLVEGVPGSDEPLRIARTLCTVADGTVLVEVCNASTEQIEIKAGAYVAAVTIVSKSAFTTLLAPTIPITAENRPALTLEASSVFASSAFLYHVELVDGTSASSISLHASLGFNAVPERFVAPLLAFRITWKRSVVPPSQSSVILERSVVSSVTTPS
ncbi:hypothetical protein PC128_g24241 [Phytophthora cactorum]|nr:hypothetical protein PC128_g24241 [Phytophthora cactorum]